jgi:uncharacterized protein with GYD domain
MQPYVLLTKLQGDETQVAFALQRKARELADNVRDLCPDVRWLGNYVTLGPWDYLDIFEAPDAETAARVEALVQECGGVLTELWPALEWNSFRSNLRHMSPAETARHAD